MFNFFIYKGIPMTIGPSLQGESLYWGLIDFNVLFIYLFTWCSCSVYAIRIGYKKHFKYIYSIAQR